MGSRGRVSSSALAVLDDPVGSVRRAEPPYALTDAEVEVWVSVVNAMPADHFMPGNYPSLTQYCRHVVASNHIAQLIQNASAGPKIDSNILLPLLRQQECESRAINALARSMRLTQQSIYKAEKVKHPKMIENPWDKNQS